MFHNKERGDRVGEDGGLISPSGGQTNDDEPGRRRSTDPGLRRKILRGGAPSRSGVAGKINLHTARPLPKEERVGDRGTGH